MDLDQLKQDRSTSLQKAVINKTAYDKSLDELGKFSFWSVPKNGLWKHQKTAICTAIAYIHGNKELPCRQGVTEAALLKLPTATGKSGIIAVIARCLDAVQRVLILTPRVALTDQLIDDLTERFWTRVGYSPLPGGTDTTLKDTKGNQIGSASIRKLLPSNTAALTLDITKCKIKRMVLVGTHQALAEIRRTTEGDDNAKRGKAEEFLLAIKDNFDIVIVDEGHYEPAVSWSRGVRELNLPTILFSATPYRNDFKAFRVGGRYLFNFPYEEAVKQKIVRRMKIQELPTSLAAGDAVSNQCDEFVDALVKALPAIERSTSVWCRHPLKVIVRASELDTLQQLQNALDRVLPNQSLLIHDKAVKTTHPHRYGSVAEAKENFNDARFWLHQHMLSEGIDEPRFVVVAIFDLMGNARQLIQQMGRVARYLRPNTGNRTQHGHILARSDTAKRIEEMWQRYGAYEHYIANNVEHIVVNEVALPDRLLTFMPEAQYIDGRFRARFDFDGRLSAQHVQLPRAAGVYQMDRGSVSLDDVEAVAEESLMEKDRFQIKPLAGMPREAIGFSYYAWQNSPYLTEQFFSEWKFGFFICILQGDFFFVHDTSGLALDMTSLGLKRVDRTTLEKIFPANTTLPNAVRTRLSRISFNSLEMSQGAIRGLAMNTHSFADTFTDLLDPSLVPATAAGFVGGLPRYVGFAKARVRDGGYQYVSIAEYIAWTKDVADQLADAARISNQVFDRYATLVATVNKSEATPKSILIDLWTPQLQGGTGDAEEGYRTADFFETAELYADVQPDGCFTLTVNGKSIDCRIEYNAKNQRYRIESLDLEDLYTIEPEGGKLVERTVLRHLNRRQSFRVLPDLPGTVYYEGNFFRPTLRWKQGAKLPVLDYVFTAPCLSPVISEKGEEFYSMPTQWETQSIFGIFSKAAGTPLVPGATTSTDPLIKAIQAIPIWLCDDDNQETADFIGFDMTHRKLVFVHAKVGDLSQKGQGFNVGGLQVVGRQAMASLTFMSRGAASSEWNSTRWTSKVKANTITLSKRNRIFGKPGKVTANQLDAWLKEVIQNPSFNKEVWIVGARMTDRAKVEAALQCTTWGNRLRQFLMHWDTMQTGCARANTRLKYFCD
ncbi:DEAD/DEAH box helicase family protein [Alcaligenes faecalis]|uniref:DEAD/DEAH box helicase n=1 Tax=Alcaligenes aquatilis TaxID=323284 RepID=UPI002AA73FC7|nr:DEAD/DEAH box helicase family protein [Alcaligenes faecalis]